MPFVDPEDAAMFLANVRAGVAGKEALPGPDGAVARAGAAYTALAKWILEERAAGTAFQDIQEAAARVAGAFMASAANSIARPPAAPAVAMLIAIRAVEISDLMAQPERSRFTAPVREGSPQ